MQLRPGDRLERFVVDAVIGRGGMAVVYRVRHAELGSVHALKVLATRNPSLALRLVQEGRLQALLRHPNAVAVQDVLRVGDAPALLVEFVEGPSLADWLERARPTVAQIDGLARGILAGVDAAHRLGLVHRDLKPGNVLLQVTHTDVTPKVSDFGLAKALDGEAAFVRTQAGTPMGTPIYMAPEQTRDASTVDARADVFSLGALLYELLLGLHDGHTDLIAAMDGARLGQAPDLSFLAGRCPERWIDAVASALAAARDERPADAAALRSLWVGDATALPDAWSPDALAEVRAAAPLAVQTASTSGGGKAAVARSGPATPARSDSTYGPGETMVLADPEEVAGGWADPGAEVGAPPPGDAVPRALGARAASDGAQQVVPAGGTRLFVGVRPRVAVAVTAGVALSALAVMWSAQPAPAAIVLGGGVDAVFSVAPVPLRAATVTDRDGASLDPQPVVSWTIEPSSVARLEGERLIPLANGTATVTAVSSGVRASYSLVVDRLPQEGRSWRSPSLGTMQWVPPGTFQMGSPPTEAYRQDDETPHGVTLTHGYWMMEQEVTQRHWERVLQVNPVKKAKKEFQGEQLPADPDLPVYRISWFDAIAFANAVSIADGLPVCYGDGGERVAACLGYRLPTEAEWERAARGGEQTVYAGTSSEAEVCAFANVSDRSFGNRGLLCDDGTKVLAAPRSYLPNPYGLYDMTGNVAEWCEDWQGPYPAEPVVDPLGARTGTARVVRGGPFHYTADTARIAYRMAARPTYGVDDGLGVRLVRGAP